MRAACLCLAFSIAHAQTVDSTAGKLLNYPARFFSKLQTRLTGLNNDLSTQTGKYLAKMQRREVHQPHIAAPTAQTVVC